MNSPSLRTLAWCCLLLSSCPAKAQIEPVGKLLPLIVRLDSGTVALRPLIGMTPATYNELRYNQGNDAALLLVRAERIAVLKQQHRQDSLTGVGKDTRIRQLMQERAEGHARESRLELQLDKVLSRPLEKPFFLNPNTYRGAAAGVLLTLAGFVYFHR